MAVSLVLRVAFICVVSVSQLIEAAPDVQLTTGQAKGVDKLASDTLKPYYAYFRIPYAQPPVGDLRFSPPQPYIGRGAGDVITSDTVGKACPQLLFPGLKLTSSEDCLHLNVYSPVDGATGSLYKVMVWIHGGGFSGGDAGGYVPSRLVTDGGVIVVVIQYRLGALGFLSSGDEALPGNLGLQDQVMALRWVKDNIRQFGGDPNDVTIFGESAGSVSVSALSISPQTSGLFNKAIMQSGTILSAWALQRAALDLFYQHAKDLNCLPLVYSFWDKIAYHNNIVRCLKGKTSDEIVAADRNFKPGDGFSTSSYDLATWALVVDGDLIPRDPASLLADRTYLEQNGILKRSYIVGMTDNEAALNVGLTPVDKLGEVASPQNVASFIRSAVRGYLAYPVASSDLNVVEFVYSYPRQPDGSLPLQNFLNLQSDVAYTIPTVKFARAIVEASAPTPVYLYLFDSEPKLRDPDGPVRGTAHAMDVYHIFDGIDLNKNDVSEFLYFYADTDPVKFPIISTALRSYLTSFAKTGKPAASIGETWPRFDRQQEKYLAISSTPEVRERLFAQRVSLWTDFLPKISRSYWSQGERVAFSG